MYLSPTLISCQDHAGVQELALLQSSVVRFPSWLTDFDLFAGNILLNIMLNASIPLKRQGKNNVSMICIPNPPLDPKLDDKKPASMLIRVKTAEDADELLEELEKHKNE